MKRSCQRQTTVLLVPVLAHDLGRAAAVRRQQHDPARQTCFCGLFRSATIASRRRRSAALTSTLIPVRIPQTRISAKPRESQIGLNRQILSTSHCSQ